MGRVSGGWQRAAPPGCGTAAAIEAVWTESAQGPSPAGQVGQVPRGGQLALWHPGLWHLLVSEVWGRAGAEGGGAGAAGAGAADPGGVGEAEDVGAEDAEVGAEVAGVPLRGEVVDEAVGAEDGVGV